MLTCSILICAMCLTTIGHVCAGSDCNLLALMQLARCSLSHQQANSAMLQLFGLEISIAHGPGGLHVMSPGHGNHGSSPQCVLSRTLNRNFISCRSMARTAGLHPQLAHCQAFMSPQADASCRCHDSFEDGLIQPHLMTVGGCLLLCCCSSFLCSSNCCSVSNL